METSRSDMNKNHTDNIGRIFTPVSWAKWLLMRYEVYEAWRNGATLIDPTCGQGSFFHALMEIAEERNEVVFNQDIQRLHGVEINPGDRKFFLKSFKNRFFMDFPGENFVHGDFLHFSYSKKFDIAVGNPPWVNFTDLPETYKQQSKSAFVKYGLVTNKKHALLGNSRIDFSSLIIQKCMKNHMVHDGKGYFYVPMSLFFNEGANRNFRPLSGKPSVFSVSEIINFDKVTVFENIAMRYGIAALKKNSIQEPVIPLARINGDESRHSVHCKTSSNGDAWSLPVTCESSTTEEQIKIELEQIPRQGMNTGGLNKVFILERVLDKNMELLPIESFVNGLGEEIRISTRFVFPLMSGYLFDKKKPRHHKYILCLHDRNGRVLDNENIRDLFGIEKYLERYKSRMKGRKGVLMQAQMSKGRFWSLFGVGPYSFSNYKVAWEAFGKRHFKAVVLDGVWQGNQAMHAFIPAKSRKDANRICNELNIRIPSYLEAFGMEGTCNWAQPGRIKRMLTTDQEHGVETIAETSSPPYAHASRASSKG